MTDPTCPPPTLHRFFRTFAGMLDLSVDSQDVEHSLGASPSGTRRLAFYGELARRSRFLALGQICPALRHCALSHGPEFWEKLVWRYARGRAPRDPDPNRYAADLPEFLEQCADSDPSIPAYLAEIADFEYSEWAVGIDPFEPTSEDAGLDRTVLIRYYSHDVLDYVRSFRSGVAAVTRPIEKPVALIIHRNLRTDFPSAFIPTRLGLCALAQRVGRSLGETEFNPEAIAQATRELERHGVLPATTQPTGVPPHAKAPS